MHIRIVKTTRSVEFLISGLFALSVFGQRNWWKSKLFMKARYISLRNEFDCAPRNSFLSEYDLDAMERLKSFQNNPNALIKIAIPTLLSMLVCPLTLFFHQPLVKFTWPPAQFPTPPDINAAVNCFLMPAGLVYAIAFGFIFQDVMSSFKQLSTQITEQVSEFSQIVQMTNAVRIFSNDQKQYICLCVKDEIIRWVEIIMGSNKKLLSSQTGNNMFQNTLSKTH